MSNQTKEYKDQAEDLRSLFDEVQAASEKHSLPDHDDKESAEMPEREVDILNLPPRKEVHSVKQGRTHVKFSSALLRLIFVIVSIVLVIGGSFILFGDELVNIFNSL